MHWKHSAQALLLPTSFATASSSNFTSVPKGFLVKKSFAEQAFALEGALQPQADWRDAVGWQFWSVSPSCAQTFPLDGNMPKIALLQIVFI